MQYAHWVHALWRVVRSARNFLLLGSARYCLLSHFAGWARDFLNERTANERGKAQAAPEGTGSESGGEGGGEGASGKVGPADFQLLRVVGQGAFGKARACPSKLCESSCWSASGLR